MTPAPLRIDAFITGPLETNTYLLRGGRESWVVDPAWGLDDLLDVLRRQGPTPTRILLTHGHGDHIAGVNELKAAFPAARLCCPAGDEAMLTDPAKNLSATFGFNVTAGAADELLQAGQILMMEDLAWQVLDTSGHSPGSLSYYCAQARVVLAGDALFTGSIGRTDIPGASEVALLANIRTHLLSLPDTTAVLPGHGPATTVGHERRSNPFLIGGGV
ncbi:MAG: MBL fold metallo-hydrolase [Phycisphaerae bacterium]|jgi:glyoxylase-like metal-dependent hydrolase (beta-lactamase superfamily II)